MVMPPTGGRLSADQVAVVRAWIDQGAAWPETDTPAESSTASSHWSFQPVSRPEPPAVSAPSFPVRNAIDAFVLATLQANGLLPSPEADRRTLIRRLYFDVIGLPPAPADIEAFVDDAAPAAYEQLVERLLASPHFGERWARHWLDVVRFAESSGFEMNQPRPNAWPYRDYVIRAFNEDKPYDRFVVEQLAGDAFGVDEATGFLVGGPNDLVKSPDPALTAQQRADELHDMVSTAGSAFLGLTVGCARCHTHKFDPIPQADYYAMTAVFAGVLHGERAMRPADWEQRQTQAAEVRRELEPIARRLAQLQPLCRTLRTLVLDDAQPPRSDGTPWVEELQTPRGVADHAPGGERGGAEQPGDRTSLPNLGKSYRWWAGVPGQAVFAYAPQLTGRWRVWLSWGCGWASHAPDAVYVLDADGDPATTDDQREVARVDQRLFADGSGEPPPDKPLWSGLRDAGVHEFTPRARLLLRCGQTAAPVTADVVVLEEASEPVPMARPTPHLRTGVQPGENQERFAPVEARFVRFTIRQTAGLTQPCIDELEVFTAEEQPRNVALAGNGTQLTVSSTLPGHAIHQPQHVHDGRYGNDHSWISNEPGQGWIQLELPQPERIDRIVWSRDREPQPSYEDRVPTQYEIAVSLDGQTWQAVASSADRLPIDYPHRPRDLTVTTGLSPNELAEFETLAQRRAALNERLAELVTSQPMVYAGVLSQPGPTFRLHRGDPLQPKEQVAPGGLTQFGSPWHLPADASDQERRLTLARWIASPDHPLTARVIVNRLWHYHFGQGIVSTPSDLGVNGGRPSHPELLDWLASELVSPRDPAVPPWSLKHIHRLILLSSTYRQSGKSNPEGLAKDAQTRLVWRFPPRRLEAEPLRDAILAVSGRLDRTAGGPGFDLFEPNTNYVKVYTSKREFGPETFRRMVYQNKPRMQLDDTFGAFDCPGRRPDRPQAKHVDHAAAGAEPAQQRVPAPAVRLLCRAAPERGGARCRPRKFAWAFNMPWAASRRPTSWRRPSRWCRNTGWPIFCRALLNANEFVMVY